MDKKELAEMCSKCKKAEILYKIFEGNSNVLFDLETRGWKTIKESKRGIYFYLITYQNFTIKRRDFPDFYGFQIYYKDEFIGALHIQKEK